MLSDPFVSPMTRQDQPCLVALLLIHGYGHYSPHVHGRHLRSTSTILNLLSSDNFVITDGLPKGFRPSPEALPFDQSSLMNVTRGMRAFGLIEHGSFAGNLSRHRQESESVHLPQDGRVLSLPAIPHRPNSGMRCGVERPTTMVCGMIAGHEQHYKLAWAFRLMELAELAGNIRYELVVRLRLDATPLPELLWQSARLCSSVRNETSALLKVHSMSDMAFWAGRAAAKIVASAWFGIATLFATTRADERPFSARALLGTLLSLPPDARSSVHYRFVNKPGVLPSPWLLGNFSKMKNDSAYTSKEIVASTAAAVEQGWDFIDPRSDQPRPPISWGGMGLRGKNLDRVDFCWCSAEKDYLVWLLANNVTVADMATR